MQVSGRLHTLATFPVLPIGQETLDAALKKKKSLLPLAGTKT
jgi:hypothetical protein